MSTNKHVYLGFQCEKTDDTEKMYDECLDKLYARSYRTYATYTEMKEEGPDDFDNVFMRVCANEIHTEAVFQSAYGDFQWALQNWDKIEGGDSAVLRLGVPEPSFCWHCKALDVDVEYYPLYRRLPLRPLTGLLSSGASLLASHRPVSHGMPYGQSKE